MGYKIVLNNGLPEMSFDPDATIGTDLLLSALVRQGAFFLDPSFGLRAMPEKITAQGLGLVKDYYAESSKWLKDAGRAKSIEITVDRDEKDRSRVSVQETAVQANDKPVTFETFVGVV